MIEKKPSFKPKQILWVDLEMTGLVPGPDVILEVGAIVTDWNFTEIAEFEAVIHKDDTVLKNMNEWSVEQHGLSGLTDRVREATATTEQVEDALLVFIDEHFDKDTPVLLAGNSIRVDRGFIAAEWPRLDARLHYRMLDVTAWKVVFEGKYHKKFAKPEDHRALGDIRGSIQELEYYLKKVKA